MGFLLFLILFLGFVGYVIWARDSATIEPQGQKAYTTREGKLVETDEAFDAWTSADLERMLSALNVRTNPIDRHFLLMGIVKECYRKRNDPEMRAKCREISELHLSEFPSIAPALKQDMGGTLPRVTTFQHYATVLTEDGDFDRAVEICELALEYGLHDGTKSGFTGRIGRIDKAREKAKSDASG